ncbi:MAG: FeoA family protein [Flavobacteriales bacterium]
MLTAADTPTLLLNELPEGQWASVVDVTVPTNPVDRDLVLRLVELGFVPGERLRVVGVGQPGREPLAVRLGHTTFALRRHEASFILVSPLT